MIRVLVGYKVKPKVDILPLLLQIRASEMTYPGFVSLENLQNRDDEHTIVAMDTWEKLSDWKAWESSTVRQKILADMADKLTEPPKVTVYTIMPTVGWFIR